MHSLHNKVGKQHIEGFPPELTIVLFHCIRLQRTHNLHLLCLVQHQVEVPSFEAGLLSHHEYLLVLLCHD